MTVEAAQIGAVARGGTRAEAWWAFPAVPLLAAAIGFTWMLHGMLQRAYGMTGEAWDLAYDQQVIWNVSQGHGFYSSFARADFLGIHLELIFGALAAIEKLWPSPIVLLIFSSAGLAAAAPGAYLFFRAVLPADRAESPWLAVALSAPIPFWAAIQEAARDFFHPENMALAFALLAAWAGIRGHQVAMWVLCVLTLMCKEDQVYTVGVIAIVMSAYGAPDVKKHWRFILYLAGAWFLIGTGIVQQHFRNGGYTDFVYYRWLWRIRSSDPRRWQSWPRSSRRCSPCRCWRRVGCSWSSRRISPTCSAGTYRKTTSTITTSFFSCFRSWWRAASAPGSSWRCVPSSPHWRSSSSCRR